MIQVVLSYEHSVFTEACIESLYNNTPDEHLNILVIDNGSMDKSFMENINKKNTVVLEYTKNYGVSTALNFALDLCSELNDDMFYISNDHYVFPNWIDPYLKYDYGFANSLVFESCPKRLDILKPFSNDISTLRDYRLKYLDYPESRSKIQTYMDCVYGKDFKSWYDENILTIPEDIILLKGDLWNIWAGCFAISKKYLNLERFETTHGLAGPEDVIFLNKFNQKINSILLFPKSFIAHFGSITVRKCGLTKDPDNHKFLSDRIPEKSVEDKNKEASTILSMRKVLDRKS